MKNLVLCGLMVLSVLMGSCSQSEQIGNVQSAKIENIRMKALSDFYGNQTRNSSDFSTVDEVIKERLTNTLEANMDFVSKNNVYTLLDNNNLNSGIIDALIDYDSNYRNQENGFELVSQKYKFNEQDIYLLAFSIESFDYIMNNSTDVTTRSVAKVAVSCGAAVAGSIITTLGAATITTGWGLGLFLVGKAVALVGVAICAS